MVILRTSIIIKRGGIGGDLVSNLEEALVWRMTGKVSILSWILQQIPIAPDQIIILKTSDLKKALGPAFVNKSDYNFSQGIKYQLLKFAIRANVGTHNDGSKLLLLSFIENV